MISIVIPVYNGEAFIRGCLESLQSQDYIGGMEVVVVDDASTDKTADVVRKFPVKLIEQQHKGPAAARNLGARSSSGDILLFTDADCVPERNWVSEMTKSFTEGISGVQGAYKTKQPFLAARFAQLEIEDRYELMKKATYIDFIGTYAAGYKKSVFLSAGGFDESFPIASGEDPELSFRLAEAGHKMVFNPNAIVYHTHPESLKKYLRQKFWRAYWRNLLYKKHKSKAVKESYTPQSLKLQMGLFYLSILSLITLPIHLDPLIPLALLVFILILSLPLASRNLRKNTKLGFLTPFIILLRTAVFSVGFLYGFIRISRKNK
jgi:glycosyltransferase involved in cell wall biosynthesis